MSGYRPAGVNKEFNSIMEKARQTNRHRDATDKACRNLPARECGPAVYLNAATVAVECGLRVRDWDTVAEGLAMLEDLQTTYALILGGGKKRERQETSA